MANRDLQRSGMKRSRIESAGTCFFCCVCDIVCVFFCWMGGGEGFCFCCFCKAKTAVGRVELVVVFLFKVCFGSSNRWCVCV